MIKTTFALMFANRTFFPASLISEARESLMAAINVAGFEYIALDEDETKYGAVQNIEEGEKFAAFLKANEGKYDGIILSLPNFGDESGAVTALRDCRVPILVQAFEDKSGQMGPNCRRDAFCGKIALMDTLRQCGIKFTTFKPHVLNPDKPGFIKQLQDFSSICSVVSGLHHMNAGAIGARTTPFKSVRFDEVTLQRNGINVETIDLSKVFYEAGSLKSTSEVLDRVRALKAFSDFSCVPEEKVLVFAKVLLVLDRLIEEYRLDSLAIRCWEEFQEQLGISPCVLLAFMNQRLIGTACELDICNSIVMRALNLASGVPSACFDWNNNFEEDEEKCILFHCGCIPNSMLKGEKSQVSRQLILEKVYGEGNCIGTSIGEVDSFDFTYASLKSEDGKISAYLGEASFIDRRVDRDFFGVYGVASVPGLQEVLAFIGQNGYRHHVCITKGSFSSILEEAFTKYLGYDVRRF
ncbi:MAG: L-fucose/L-arabinose isomerase family protein [Ruminiclostridium sp.]